MENVGGVGIIVIDTWPKCSFEIWPFLWFYGGQNAKWSIWVQLNSNWAVLRA